MLRHLGKNLLYQLRWNEISLFYVPCIALNPDTTDGRARCCRSLLQVQPHVVEEVGWLDSLISV